MTNKILPCAICAVALCASCAQKPEARLNAGINFANLDTTARPGDDFFQYATAHWIDHNPQPAAYPRWGSFTKLADDNTNQLAELIQGIAAQQHEKGSISQKIGDLYNMVMDSTRRNELGAAPLKPYLDKINAIQTREELLTFMAKEHDGLFFGVNLGADAKNAGMNIVGLYQGGLSLGNRDYYLKDDEANVKVREAWKQHVVNLYKLAGFDETTAKAKMETVYKYESQLAPVHYSRVQLRDPEANYHKMDLKTLSEATNGFDWATYFKNYGYDKTDSVDCGQPEPIALGCKLLMTAPLEDLKTFYEERTIAGLAGTLSDDFVEENFKYNQALTGAKEMQPRWKRAVNTVDGTLGEAVGLMYVEKYFPARNKERMLELVHNLQKVLGERIKAQEWMSDSTKQVALEKLATFYVKIGYPDQWDDLSKLVVDPEKNLTDNMHEISNFYWNLDKEKHYNRPVNKDEWLMTPQTVNAYYNPTTNEICFPAGILQPPFFDMSADDAMNYGAIGVVIGHEMTHGFDDQGRQFDKDGNMRVWWNQEDVERFKVPAEQLATFFDSLWVIPGELHANGHQCLGENLADHGGVNIAYQAFKEATAGKELPVIEGFTPEQRFFLSYANVWAGVTTNELLHYYAMVDVHSAQHLRVNGTLPHIDTWYEAFGIKPGDKLYVAPEDRVKIW